MSGTNVYFENNEYESATFTSNGTFTVPSGVNLVFVELWGGGGAGCGPQVINDIKVNYGGESGKLVHGQLPVTPGASIPVTIGTGGAGSTVQSVGADGTATIFGSFKSPGGFGGGRLSDNSVILIHEIAGQGQGRDSMRSAGGAGVFPGFGEYRFGGDAGHGAGGAATADFTPAGNGGLGAGGGAGGNSSGAAGGSGGNGIAIIYWKVS